MTYSPWFYALHCLATGIVNLFSVMDLSVCPNRTAEPPGSPVLRGSGSMGSPVSGRGCVLPQSAIVTKTIPPTDGLVPGLRDWVPCLRSGLCSSACDRNKGYPSFWWDWFWAFTMGSPFSGSSVRGGFPHLIGTKALPMHLLCIPSG